MFQDIFIIGATGRVGGELINQIYELKDTDSNLHTNPTRIVGVASSKTYLYKKEGLEKKDVFDFSKNKMLGKPLLNINDLLKVVSKSSDIIFIDVSAGMKDLLDFHLKVLRETSFRIVCANKNPLVISTFKEFQELIKERSRYGYRCSVMAGAEAVNKMLDLLDLNDKPKNIDGCFSGTLGLISTELEKGVKLSSALNKAISEGYTEPNPVLDLVGDDVAKKMLILTRSAGYPFEFCDVLVKPFVPKRFLSTSNSNNLIKGIKLIDEKYYTMFKTAVKKGFTYRYVGSFDSKTNKVLVSLRKVRLFSPLGQLKGTANKVVIVTNTYSKNNPYIVESPGAGLKITAQNIRRDLLSMINERWIIKVK